MFRFALYSRALAPLFLTLLLLFPSLESGASDKICRFDSRGGGGGVSADCPTQAGKGKTAIGNDWWGARVNRSWMASTPFDVWSLCRYVDNVSADKDIFVPFRNQAEWSSFISAYPSYVLLTTCARPFEGIDKGRGLYFGPTSKQEGKGDTGDDAYYKVNLPYERTGGSDTSLDGPTHTFNHSCYHEYKKDHCWKWIQQTCSSCDGFGNCTDYDCTYCGDWGSVCEKEWHPWNETFSFTGFAGNSDNDNPSWTGSSGRSGGTARPDICLKRCTFDGHDCTCFVEPAAEQTPSCPPLTASPWLPANYMGGGTDGGRVLTGVATIIANTQIVFAIQTMQGDCAGSAKTMEVLNNYIDAQNMMSGWPLFYK